MRFKPRKAILTWCNARAPKLPGMETSVPGSGTPGGGLAENEVIHHDHFSGITVMVSNACAQCRIASCNPHPPDSLSGVEANTGKRKM